MTNEEKDDPRQAAEEGDPQESGRVRGHVYNEQQQQQEQAAADKTNPDDPAGASKPDASAATPHWESGDRG